MKRKTNIIVSCLLILSMLSGCAGNVDSAVTDSSADITVSSSQSVTSSESTESTTAATTATQAATAATTTKLPETSAPETEASTAATTTNTPAPETTVTVATKPQTTTTTKPQTTTTKPQTTTTKPQTTTTVFQIPPEFQPDPDDSPVMAQYKEKYEKIQKFINAIEKSKTTPTINITTLDNEQILSKEYYVESVIDVFNCDEQYRLTAEGGVRVRGNSTAEGDEKPYRIKFEKKQNMLGLHDGIEFKNWVLLKSNWNLVMDYTGFELAETIFDGKYYSSDCTFVNVYVNRSFKGIYLLCEQNQVNKNRVDVYEPGAEEYQTDIGYFIEIDNYAGQDDDPFFSLDYDGITFTDYQGTTKQFERDDFSIKSDTTCDEQRQFIEKYTKGVFKIMYEAVENNNLLMFDKDYNVVSANGTYTTAKEAVGAVLDLDSVVNTMILQELVHNYDVGAGSFYMAVDFSADSKYKKLTFTAPWDFNWAYNDSPSGGYYAGAFQTPVHDMYERSNYWLTVIMKVDWFRDMLKAKWAELDNGKALNVPLANVLKAAKALEKDLGNDAWKIDSAKQVIDFVRGRITWLNGQWK